mmetsp:Transcript_22778/g.36339  ORF Transcript_22778/g.36339 Transcript_22778/m.36339 type:complete len:910 (-) Transcript_22778:1274-4003(-)|eukprot:CAMPEP_0203758296 /NCGR_PEP_ID=MMETSP0098-20131031/11068_1 /ASSEMBLY_ACC=CAM_ASM_000208 /TAXON_ID=96639 /ORGANISM=" , Strain NY0313808BC1" /LENGTH=909 /DNA_ID=CAMNT_0050650635 /DNA_START=172 /DNA_END=2901 /DNA_ORIENTATION=-
MDNLSHLLLNTHNQNAAVREPAEKALLELERTQLPDLVVGLAKELGTEGGQDASRISAALLLKRILTGQDEASRHLKLQQWEALSNEARDYVKEACLQALRNSPVAVSKQAAQTMEAVAKLQLSTNDWPNLPETLVNVFDDVLARDSSKIAGPILALGYFASVAADVDYAMSEEQVNALLGKIAVGMNPDMPDEVQIAATSALLDTLDFARHNMDNKKDRDAIMELILKMTTSRCGRAVEKAFECLTSVVQLYYHRLPEYMEAIWARSMDVIQKADINDDESESVAKQALNFWSEMAREEKLRKRYKGTNSPDPMQQFYGFVDHIKEPLCKLVLDFCLLQQDETPCDNEKTDDKLYGAAEHCFVELCEYWGEDADVVSYTLNFVQVNLVHTDWRHRQAALFAFGSIIRKKTPEMMKDHVNNCLEVLVQRMLIQSEQVAPVRETAAWTIAQICSDYLPSLNPAYVQPMVLALIESLKDKARVAHMAATALYCFASAFVLQETPHTNQLSTKMNNGQTYFQALAIALWSAGTREDPDGPEWQLMEDSYEALIKFVEASARDMAEPVGQILKESIKRLQEIATGKVRDLNRYQEVELVAVVISCTIKLEGAIAAETNNGNWEIPHQIVQTMLQILSKPQSNAHADALQAIGEVCRIVGDKFQVQYFAHIAPCVIKGLQNRDSAQTCIAAVRLCGDIFTAMRENKGDLVKPAQDGKSFLYFVMSEIIDTLKRTEVTREVKPSHLSVFGDISDAVGPKDFQPFFQPAMRMALDASNICIDITDEEMGDYLNEIREAAVEAMENMLYDAQIDPETMNQILILASRISEEVKDPRAHFKINMSMAPDGVELSDISYRVSDNVIRGYLGILGDIAKFTPLIKSNPNGFEALFAYGSKSDNQDIKETCQYAMSKIGWR